MRQKRLIAIAVIAVLLTAVGVMRLVRADRDRAALRDLTETVRDLRFSADSCSVALNTEETQLAAYRLRLDSLHDAVREFEADDPRGVALNRYDDYLAAFGLYSDSADAWAGRVDTLRSRLEQCQAVARSHNAAVDSLRAARAVHEP